MLICWGWKNKTGGEEKYWINKVKAGEREARFGLVQYQMCFRNWWRGPRVLHVLFTDHHRTADLSPQGTGQVLCPRVEYWLKAHTFTHTRACAHTLKVPAQYSTTVTFWLGWSPCSFSSGALVCCIFFFFLNLVIFFFFFLFSLSNSASLFQWQMAHHSENAVRQQTPQTN